MEDYNIVSEYVKPIGTKVKVPENYGGKHSLIAPFVAGKTGTIIGYGKVGSPKPKEVNQITEVKIEFDGNTPNTWIPVWSCFHWELEYPCEELEQP